MVVSCNNTVKEVHYSGHTISKIYACGNLVWSSDTPTPPPSSGTGKIHFYRSDLPTNTDPTDCITAFTDISTSAYPRNYEFDMSGDTICGLRGIDIESVVKRGICSVVFPDNTREVAGMAFYRQDEPQSISSLDRPVIAMNEGLETIGTQAFCGYVHSTNRFANGAIIIPSTVTSIGYEAFNLDNASFQSSTTYGLNIRFYFKSQTPPSMNTIFGTVVSQMNSVITIYVPYGSTSAYREALGSMYSQLRIEEYDGNITYLSDSWTSFYLSSQGLINTP